jgi:hypothetical protein
MRLSLDCRKEEAAFQPIPASMNHECSDQTESVHVKTGRIRKPTTSYIVALVAVRGMYRSLPTLIITHTSSHPTKCLSHLSPRPMRVASLGAIIGRRDRIGSSQCALHPPGTHAQALEYRLIDPHSGPAMGANRHGISSTSNSSPPEGISPTELFKHMRPRFHRK